MRNGQFEEHDTPVFSISTAASLLGLSQQMLRVYEAEGLVLPYRTSSNQRRYSRSDLHRIQCMRRAIQEEQLTISGIKRMLALIPCWQITGCSEKDRVNCQSYSGHKQPCWSYRHMNNTCAERECRACPVYQLASSCEEIKASIIRSTTRQ